MNEESHVCCFMFHEYSLDNFREQFKELYYDEIAPTDARWKISFEEKQNKDGNRVMADRKLMGLVTSISSTGQLMTNPNWRFQLVAQASRMEGPNRATMTTGR